MKKMKIAFALALLAVFSAAAIAQTDKPKGIALTESNAAQSERQPDSRSKA